LAGSPLSACFTDTTRADYQQGELSSVDVDATPGSLLLEKPLSDTSNYNVTGSGVGITITNWGGQTFTPTNSGQIVKADIRLFCSGCTGTTPNLTLSVRATTNNTPASSVPTGADLGSCTIPGFNSGSSLFYSCTFGTPVPVTGGTMYALVIRPTANPAPGTYALSRSVNSTTVVGIDVYAPGNRVLGATSGTVWSVNLTGGVANDAAFVVYVDRGYAASGNEISTPKDSSALASLTSVWSTLSWSATTPANTAVKFQVAGSNSENGPFNFVGPDNTPATFFTTSGSSLDQFYGKRYLKYKAILESTDPLVTPTVDDVTICSNSLDCSGSIAITPGAVAVCPLSNANSADGPAGATSYAWSIVNGSINGSTTSQSITFTAGASGNVQLLLEIVEPAGCHKSTSLNIPIDVVPTPTITPGGPTTFCAGGSVTLTSSSAIGNQWYLDGNPIGAATGQQYVATAPGSYTVVATDPILCSSPASSATVVTVNPLPATPTITPGGPTTFCAGGSVTLTSSSASGNQWYLNGNPIGGQTNMQYVATASGSYTVTVTDGNSCQSPQSSATVVTVNPIPTTPTITPGGPTTFCAGGSVTLNSSSATGNQWLLNGNPIGGATGQTYIASVAGDYTVTVTTTGCTSAASSTTTVTINTNPDATISAPGSVSASSTGNVASVASAGGGATYNWGITGGTITGGAGTNSITFTAGAAGTLTLNVTVTNASNCSDTKSANVSVGLAVVGVTSVTPNAGTTLGGTSVTIAGSNFASGASVTFGGSAATNVVVVNSGQITAKTPAHAAGAVNVTVTNTDTSTNTLVNGYTYNAQNFDPNGDSTIDPSDIFYLIAYLFTGGPAPSGAAGMPSGDANGDGVVDPADIFYAVNYLFGGGAPPHVKTPGAPAVQSARQRFSGSLELGQAVLRNGRWYAPVVVTMDANSDAPQAVSLRVRFQGATTEATVRRAAGLSPIFEVNRSNDNTLSYLLAFGPEAPLSLGSGRSMTIAEIEVSAPGAFAMELDPSLTMLVDGTGRQKATVANHALRIRGAKAEPRGTQKLNATDGKN
jgi:hypothetical protein